MSDTGTGGNPNAQRRIEEREDDDLRKQVAELLRRDAARDAGLDLSNPMHRLFVDTYQGSPSEMGAKAKEYGLLSAEEQAQEQAAADATAALTRTGQAAAQQGAGGSGSQASQEAEKQRVLGEEAAALKKMAETRQGDRQMVLDWAKRAGVPFVDDDA